MRIIIITVIGFLFGATVASPETAYRYADSKVVDNLFVRVYFSGKAGANNLDCNEKIRYSILTFTNETTQVFFPKTEYICQMELRDEKGTYILKTYKGSQLGRDFTKLTQYTWDVINKRGRNTGGSEKPDMDVVSTNKAQGRSFDSPVELFDIKNAGQYKLLLHLQVFKLVRKQNSHTFKLVRFPAFEVPIVKIRNQESED